ncbi:TBC1 domain family member 5 homolog B-like [Anopheles cruzii]|uniref:TBC1 domain family member 5 homolog B-like n=1 Tax=Anopheles cruzii TaxID=68878 RepID=UPI0022EC41CF|nr:TBC1 domain family member 5 homolog B-like [Anopheles cruzii]
MLNNHSPIVSSSYNNNSYKEREDSSNTSSAILSNTNNVLNDTACNNAITTTTSATTTTLFLPVIDIQMETLYPQPTAACSPPPPPPPPPAVVGTLSSAGVVPTTGVLLEKPDVEPVVEPDHLHQVPPVVAAETTNDLSDGAGAPRRPSCFSEESRPHQPGKCVKQELLGEGGDVNDYAAMIAIVTTATKHSENC